jgi:hypothetical protein
LQEKSGKQNLKSRSRKKKYMCCEVSIGANHGGSNKKKYKTQYSKTNSQKAFCCGAVSRPLGSIAFLLILSVQPTSSFFVPVVSVLF